MPCRKAMGAPPGGGAPIMDDVNEPALLARIIHERCTFVHNAPAASGSSLAAGFDTALRAVLKTAPG